MSGADANGAAAGRAADAAGATDAAGAPGGEPLHPLDQALRLQPDAAAQDRYHGQTHPGYWNMVGPFGGITAATMLQAVLQHPRRLGEPVALTVNYAGALVAGPFVVHARPVRSNRSTQHWMLSMEQPGADGAPTLVTTATAVTALRRTTWGADELEMPAVPPPPGGQTVAPPEFAVQWLARYQLHPVCGAIPSVWDGSASPSLTQLWLRDAPERPLDFCALAALADVFYPRLWLRRARLVATGTVSLSVYFHAGSAQLHETGSGHLLGQARGQVFRNGFFDQSAQLWNAAGCLLATSHQIVYYKE